jgi:hypothetical protein
MNIHLIAEEGTYVVTEDVLRKKIGKAIQHALAEGYWIGVIVGILTTLICLYLFDVL